MLGRGLISAQLLLGPGLSLAKNKADPRNEDSLKNEDDPKI